MGGGGGLDKKKSQTLCVKLQHKKYLSGVGFEPTLPLENQSLNLAP